MNPDDEAANTNQHPQVRRNRHGVPLPGEPTHERDLGIAIDLRRLSTAVRSIFIDRNAQGAPPKERAAIRAAMRPHLRDALKFLTWARTARIAGDKAGFKQWITRAQLELANAQIAFRQPFMEQAAKIRHAVPGQNRGGRPKRKAQAEKRAAEWAADFARRKANPINESVPDEELYKDMASDLKVGWETIRDTVQDRKPKT